MLVVVGTVGVVLSFGPRLSLYAWLYHAVSPLQGIRGAARFGLLGLFAVAGLASFGLAHLRGLAERRSAALANAVGALVLVAVTAEAWRAPIGWTPAVVVPPIYAALDHDQPAAVAELPFPSPARVGLNAFAMLASTHYHYRPLVNGYSGFIPASYTRHAERLAGFPDEESHRFLVTAGVTHVVVRDTPDAGLPARADATPWLVRRAQSPGLTLYRVLR
jgi:hypothetical protein